MYNLKAVKTKEQNKKLKYMYENYGSYKGVLMMKVRKMMIDEPDEEGEISHNSNESIQSIVNYIDDVNKSY